MHVAPALMRLLQVPLTADNAFNPTHHGKACISGSSGSGDSTPGSPGFNGLIYELLEHYHVPGIAVAIVHGNKTFTEVTGTC